MTSVINGVSLTEVEVDQRVRLTNLRIATTLRQNNFNMSRRTRFTASAVTASRPHNPNRGHIRFVSIADRSRFFQRRRSQQGRGGFPTAPIRSECILKEPLKKFNPAREYLTNTEVYESIHRPQHGMEMTWTQLSVNI